MSAPLCPEHEREHDGWDLLQDDAEQVRVLQRVTRNVCAGTCRRGPLRLDPGVTCPGCDVQLAPGDDVVHGRLPGASRTTGLVLWHTACHDGRDLL